jgi:hypothetical protein
MQNIEKNWEETEKKKYRRSQNQKESAKKEKIKKESEKSAKKEKIKKGAWGRPS